MKIPGHPVYVAHLSVKDCREKCCIVRQDLSCCDFYQGYKVQLHLFVNTTESQNSFAGAIPNKNIGYCIEKSNTLHDISNVYKLINSYAITKKPVFVTLQVNRYEEK
ncbi:uncharacterized protein LOC143152371 [Ptiloglossa arizonensis]|uniref:uncharacterized protein LOC143152371 n=1 Tax=Ptiloglossa arizonensis TaxID=3350558 RepID=UPI003FA00FED